MDRLAAMRSFLQVVDRGGFAAAGRDLGLSGPMVGNHVRFLEAQLGGLLLNRTTRAQSLTELGRAYLTRCRAVMAELDAADADAAELLGAPRGCLRVTAPHSIGATVLPPIIAAFLLDHPFIKVDLRLDDRRLDLLPEGVDAAIRVGELQDTSLLTRALPALELTVCAAPGYIDRRGEPTTLTDLAVHHCLDFTSSPDAGSWCFETDQGPQRMAVTGPFSSNSVHALRTAALEGAGIVMLPRLLVDEDIRRGALKPLLGHAPPQCRPVQLITLPGPPTPKLRRFSDALIRSLSPCQL